MKLDKLIILPIAIGAFQFFGFNIIVISLLIIGTMISVSKSIPSSSIRKNNNILIFILISILIGLLNLKNRIPDNHSILVWSQFYFFALYPLLINKKDILFDNIKKIIVIIFLLDVSTNLLLLINIEIPWAIITDVRPGEEFARFPGVKGNHLFSSLFSFLILVFALDYKQFDSNKTRYFLIFLAILNLLLAGARRSIIMAILIILLSQFKYLRKSKISLLSSFFGTIILVVFLTFLTTESNGSNFLRAQLWVEAIYNISNNPIFGHGFFYPNLSLINGNYSLLSEVGVTESFALLIAFNFGIPAFIMFVYFNIKTLFNSIKNYEYNATLGVFYGLSIELYFGGSLENTIAIILFFLSATIINEEFLNKIKT